ncbi:hypothetical protein DWX23_23590 [Parabacteroides sp. AF18-52]|nr:hypothetical protein DWX23_23590 [Parabacteroides sp. AF18-52]
MVVSVCRYVSLFVVITVFCHDDVIAVPILWHNTATVMAEFCHSIGRVLPQHWQSFATALAESFLQAENPYR